MDDACPTARAKAQHAIARDREVFKYFHAVNLRSDLPPEQTQIPYDPCLAAFAQYITLRLRVKRSVISLVAKDIPYILAEHGEAFRRSSDDDTEINLTQDTGILNTRLGAELRTIFYHSDAPPYVVINDLSQDDRFREKEVVAYGGARFLVTVPVRVPQSWVVMGNIMVVDNIARDGLDDASLNFLVDMAAMVTNYLDSSRVKQTHYRSEMMVRALGSFLEGKSSLEDWWKKSPHRSLQSELIRGFREGLYLSRVAPDYKDIDATTLLRAPEEPTDSSRNDVSTGPFSRRRSDVGMALRTGTFEPTMGLHEAALSEDVKQVFVRASNLIREAILVDGVVFFEPNMEAGRKSLQVHAMNDPPVDDYFGNAIYVMDGSEEEAIKGSDSDDRPNPPSNEGETFCRILGHSIGRTSTAGDAGTDLPHFPETMLRRFVKKYVNGRVFHFEDDGSIASDSDSTGTEATSPEPSGIKPRAEATFKREAAKVIQCVLPSARSVAWLPIWNQKEERWLAGALIWTTSPTRILCPEEDLGYIQSFGNSMGAEIARLSAVKTSHIKTDFISSISHELRSPLHGVLASVEFLQETPMTELQFDMVSNIQDSGKVLLDTINHVLEFSKMESRTSRLARRRGPNGQGRSSQRPKTRDAVDICMVSEEVLNSLYTGRQLGKFTRSASGEAARLESLNTGPVKVIINMDYRRDWNFIVDSGALRRILMNIFSNSLKYTKEGFVNVGLKVGESFTRDGKPCYTLVLRINDSGVGISEEFLKNHICEPFAQEDSMTSGTGLGLSIVHRIIRDLRGHIEFRSEKGIGTEVTVCLPLTAPPPSAPAAPSAIADIREKTRDLGFFVDGFDLRAITSPTTLLDVPNADKKATLYLLHSVRNMMSDWFGMEDLASTAKSQCSVAVLFETELSRDFVNQLIEEYSDSRKDTREPSVVVVLCSSFTLHDTIDQGPLKVFYLQQPFGPHKMADVLRASFGVSGKEMFGDQPEPLPTPESFCISPPPSTSLSPPPSISPADASTTETFEKLRIPSREETPPIRSESPAVPPKSASSRNTRALLVDDNEINLKLLAAYMRKLNVEYVTASDGLQAFNAYKEAGGKFAVVFMDITMPVMTGTESSRNIRLYESEHQLHKVPIIALTGGTSAAAEQEAFRAGIDMFLTKPVALRTLKPILEDALKQRPDEGSLLRKISLADMSARPSALRSSSPYSRPETNAALSNEVAAETHREEAHSVDQHGLDHPDYDETGNQADNEEEAPSSGHKDAYIVKETENDNEAGFQTSAEDLSPRVDQGQNVENDMEIASLVDPLAGSEETIQAPDLSPAIVASNENEG